MMNLLAMVYGFSQGIAPPFAVEWENPIAVRRWLMDRVSRYAPLNIMLGGGDGGGGGSFGGGPEPGGGGGGTPAAGAAAAASAALAGGGGLNPYNQGPWLFPPSDYLNLDVGPGPSTIGGQANNGAVAIPAVAGKATILTYIVPQGRVAKISAIGIDFLANGGAAFVEAVIPPTLVFNVLVDNKPVPGFGAFSFLPGSVSTPNGTAGFFAKPGQRITIVVNNISLAATTQTLAARIQGYLLSETLYNKMQGYA